VRRALAVVLLVFTTLVGRADATPGAEPAALPVVHLMRATTLTPSRALRVDVAFVGDSNVVRAAGVIRSVLAGVHSLTDGNRHYVPSFWDRAGAPLDPKFWSAKIGNPHFHPNVVVLNIGINDTLSPASYANYGAKINAFMRLIPSKVPVLFPGYPYAIERPSRRAGALAVNHAWAMAQARWPNLVIVPWGALANRHPEWINRSGPNPNQWVHYTKAGYKALTTLEVATLNQLRR
jgi:hypothetical protein